MTELFLHYNPHKCLLSHFPYLHEQQRRRSYGTCAAAGNLYYWKLKKVHRHCSLNLILTQNKGRDVSKKRYSCFRFNHAHVALGELGWTQALHSGPSAQCQEPEYCLTLQSEARLHPGGEDSSVAELSDSKAAPASRPISRRVS